jgi:hypothetical protein
VLPFSATDGDDAALAAAESQGRALGLDEAVACVLEALE